MHANPALVCCKFGARVASGELTADDQGCAHIPDVVAKSVELAAKKVGPEPTFLFQGMESKQRMIELVEPVLMERGLELVDVEQRPEGRGQVVRLLVDREGGVDLEELSRLSRELSDLFDVEEPVPGAYTLEVSSPGINRPLRTPEHFVRYIGKKVRVRSHEPVAGQRNFVGTVTAVTAGGVTLRSETGSETTIFFSNLEKANYEHEFTAADFAKRTTNVPR
jgi:ribosome maturation factor RimP